MYVYITYICHIYVYRVFISIMKGRRYLNIFQIKYFEGQIVQLMSNYNFLFIPYLRPWVSYYKPLTLC